MDVATTVLTILIAPAVVLLLGWYCKGRFDTQDRRIDRLDERINGRIDAVDGRIDRLETRMDGRFDRLESRMDGRFDVVNGHIEGLRSDLTRVALAVGARPTAENA